MHSKLGYARTSPFRRLEAQLGGGRTERERLETLRQLDILDTPAEVRFDDITQLLATLCEVPVALISLVDERRQWFKSRVGLEVLQTPREVSFCSHAIEQSDLFVIDDARSDARFAGNPLVVGEPGVRFYAGAPLVVAGSTIGTLCIADYVPRTLSPLQARTLRVLSRQVAAQMELRDVGRKHASAEASARESAQRWEFAIEGAADGLWDWDLARQEVFYSRRWKEMLGYEEHEISTSEDEWRSRIHPEDLARVAACHAAHESGEQSTYVCEYRLRARDQSWKWVLVRGMIAERDEQGRPRRLIGTSADITPRKHAETALRESEELHRLVISSLSEGIVVQGAGGEITTCNASAERILGLTADQMRGRTSLDPRWRAVREDGEPFPGEQHPAMVALRTGEPQLGVIMGVHKTETELSWISINALPMKRVGATVGVVCSFSDITEKRAADVERQYAKRRLDAAVQVAGVSIWEWEIPTGNAHFGEGAWEQLGYDPRTQPSRYDSWQSKIHPDDIDRVEAALEAHFTGEAPLYRAEYRMRTDRGFLWMQSTGSVVERSPDGSPLRMLGARIDVTERKQMEERLALSERMASLGTLAAGVAHEINNPLTFVLGNLTVLEDRIRRFVSSDATSREQFVGVVLGALEDAQAGARRVRDVVDDLRSLSRPELGPLGAVDLEHVLESSIQIAMHELGPRARLVREYAPVPPVLGRETRLGQVFVNLLVNAAQSITPGDAGRQQVTVSMRVGTDDQVIVEMRDTGQGIAAELLPRIFDPFFTTKHDGTGSGLGLPICHRIIASHGGALEVESTEGVGTLVRIILRAAPVDAPVAALPAPWGAGDAHPGPQRQLRVLVIDDEPAVGRVVQRHLTPEYEIVTEHSALSALERYRAGDWFDVILCDVVMPVLAGDGFLDALRKIAPAQAERVLFMTGGADNSAAHRFLQSVSNSFLAKPFSLSDLRNAIAECAARGAPGPSGA